MRLAPALIACLVVSARCYAQTWWDDAWACRRTVEVNQPVPQRPGEEAVFASFPTGGFLQADGADIRVLAEDKPAPHKIIFIGPGDRVSLLFRYVPGCRRYYIYYGNPQC